ncbi:alpha/beta hydrolase [Carboxylicivirga linearis]|uniref:Alpha/beta hydrolase n=1 Tax=Carboxylicivirga linearis TaxID=1628157 RepID=A0ABS5JRG6_9BACT|nr:alpha/beta hydrolase [Carboxylicivirga linearis]MBS2097498.1 alpha/beta hydrolase [Carboxylicivirga linearis]
MKYLIIAFTILLSTSIVSQTKYKTETNKHYYSDAENQQDAYKKERCVLDIYYPENVDGYATIVWFHGGGLTGGQKEIPEALKNKGVAVVGVNYRLYPKVKAPEYINDAAAAVAWVMKNIANYGGDSTLVFVSGHSAGGYLTSMVGLDKSYLAKHDVDANNIAGLIPFSGHTITHFTVRKERGIPGEQPIIDSLAPLYHVRADAPPMLLITGDRELEMLGRYEENAYMFRMMKVAGHKDIRLFELDGYNHGMTEPAFPLLINEVNRIVRLHK